MTCLRGHSLLEREREWRFELETMDNRHNQGLIADGRQAKIRGNGEGGL